MLDRADYGSDTVTNVNQRRMHGYHKAPTHWGLTGEWNETSTLRYGWRTFGLTCGRAHMSVTSKEVWIIIDGYPWTSQKPHYGHEILPTLTVRNCAIVSVTDTILHQKKKNFNEASLHSPNTHMPIKVNQSAAAPPSSSQPYIPSHTQSEKQIGSQRDIMTLRHENLRKGNHTHMVLLSLCVDG